MSILKAFIVPHPPLIVPEIGRREEKKIQKTVDAYLEMSRAVAEEAPDTVVIVSPHSTAYADYIHISPGESANGSFLKFGASRVHFEKQYDTEFVSALESAAKNAGLSAGTRGEHDAALDHGVMVPLYFIEKFMIDFKIVRIGISGLGVPEHYRLGSLIAQTAEKLGRKTVLIASGDLSHRLAADGPYGYAKEGPEFDEQVTAAMKAADFFRFLAFDEDFCDAAGECGLRSFIMMAGALDGKAVDSRFLSYEGPFGVGYAVCAYTVTGTDESRRFGDRYEQEEKSKAVKTKESEDDYVKLARYSLEHYVQSKNYAARPENLPDALVYKRAGVFVSLKKSGRLRGCIGTIAPTTDCIADEIIRNAVSAGSGDPRFSPVTKQELDELVYSVDVLENPEPIASMGELDPMRYGVIVSNGGRRGLLLPDLEGVDTAEKQVSIARQKAGIGPKETIELERFEVVRHK